MSKARSTGNLNNSIVISDTGAITFVSGSTTLATLNTAGQLSGSTPVVFAATSSFANAFTVAGTLTAQTLVVQTVTSSVSFITGSTRFGSIVSNTHQFTGSMGVTGSLSVVTNGTEFQVNPTGVNLGNALTDSHIISGSLSVNPNGLFVSGSGLVGIGTTVPSYTLDVSGSGRFNGNGVDIFTSSGVGSSGVTGLLRVVTAGTSTGIAIGQANSSRYTAIQPNEHIIYNDDFFMRTNGAFPLSLGTNNTIRLSITSAGLVGVGVSPDGGNGIFDVVGFSSTMSSTVKRVASFYCTTAENADRPGIILGYDTNGAGVIGARTQSSGQPLAFWTYNGSSWGERMRITSGGNVGLATSSPAALLSLKGRGGADIIFQMNDENNVRRCFYIPNQYYGYMWAVGVVSNGGKAFSFGNQDGNEVGTIVINAGGVAYNTTSDYRLKEDLKDFNGLEKVSAIKVYDFKWKNLDERTDGVLAHELAEVLPYAVSGVKDALNHEGKIEAQSVDYSKLTPVLVKAIQELKAENDTLKEILQRNNIQ